MKKLLTVSVLAIMAVSAANADIASTGYVDKQTGAVDGAITYTGKNYINGATDLKAATESLDAAIKGVADKVGTTDVSAQISGAIAAAKVENLSDGADYAKTADVVTNAELEAIDGNITGSGVVTSISQLDGNVTATLTKITDAEVDSISKEKITGLGALASKNTVTQAEVEGLTDALGGKADKSNTYTKTEVDDQISDSISEFDTGLTDLKDTVAALPTTYAPINTVEVAEQEAITNAAKAITDTIGSGFTKDSTVASQLGAVKTTADNAAKSIGDMDATYAAQDGKYIASVTQADGKVTATYADLTDVAKMKVPEVCNGTATCALVWNKNTKKLDWEAIMQ